MSADGIAGKTLADEIRDRVQAAYDPGLADAIHREMCFTYGAEDNANMGITVSGDRFKIYPDVSSETQQIGKVRKSLKGASAFLSRLMSAEPMPEFEGIHEAQKAVREGYWRSRWYGDGDSNDGIFTHARDSWLSGWMHGYAGCVTGLVTDRKSKKQKVIGKHFDPRYIILDDLCRDPRDADWACFWELIPIYEANKLFDKETVQERKITLKGSDGYVREAALVGHYYDVGLGEVPPKMARFLGGMSHKPVHVMDNPFERIPCAWMVHLLLPGMRRPIGQVVMTQAAEEAQNLMLQIIKEKARRGQGHTVIDTSRLTPQSVAAIRAGNFDVILEPKDPEDSKSIRPIVEHIQTSPADPVIFQHMQYMGQEINEQLGLSEVGRGSSVAKEQTKFEVEQMEQNASANNAGPEFATRMFLRDLMMRVFEIGRDFDRHPFTANVMGHEIDFNVDGEPSSSLGLILKPKATIKVTEDSLVATGNLANIFRKLRMYQWLLPFVGKGISMPEFLARALAIMREPDADALLAGAEATQIQPGSQPGADGQGGAQPVPVGNPLQPGQSAPMQAQGAN